MQRSYDLNYTVIKIRNRESRADGSAPPDNLPPPAILPFGADFHLLMSTTTPPSTENDPTRPISLLSLGRNTFIAVMNGMLTGHTDAGGPQGISQLLILKDVMERLSKGESGGSRGTVKRPWEVFDMIGGVGTGGSV
jgi:hypothetical protein